MKSLCIVFSSFLLLMPRLVQAQTTNLSLTVLAPFSSAIGPSGVIRGMDGNLYGTTLFSTNSDQIPSGSVFKVTPSGQMSVVYKFPPFTNISPVLAFFPNGVIQARDGYLYGTSLYGGVNNAGTIFRVSTNGHFSLLYSFAGQYDGTNYSGYPQSKLVEGADGNLYGSDSDGIFKFSPASQAFTRMQSFSDYEISPLSPLVQGSDGYLYGVTQYGGQYSDGMIFQCDTNGQFLTDWYDFGSSQDIGGKPLDGYGPTGLVEDGTTGNFYGTAHKGGANDSGMGGDGTLFVFSAPSPQRDGGGLQVLYNFDSTNGDGSFPIGPLVAAPGGLFFGVTQNGGANGKGSVFAFTNGSDGIDFPISFSQNTGGFSTNSYTYYDFPPVGLTLSSNGILYGVTETGGLHGDGTVYKITGAELPQFTYEPGDQTFAVGDAMALSVGVSGYGALTYKWYFAGKLVANGGNVSGATTATLTISNLSTANSGNYILVVTDAGGSVTNIPIKVTVLGINISSPTNYASLSTAQSFGIKIAAASGTNYSQVTFYLDGQPLGASLAAPYSFQVPAGSITPGAHTLTASGLAYNAEPFSPPVSITVTAPGTAFIDFDALNATAGAVGGTPLSSYLAGYGVTVSGVTVGSELEAVNANSAVNDIEVEPSSPPNYFTQDGPGQPLSFTLNFARPLQSLSFTRAGLYPYSGLVSHPQWTATAYDTNGNALSSVTEPLVQTNVLPAKSFSLTGNGIASVTFASDSEGVAAFSAVLLDDLLLDYNPTTNLLSDSLSVISGSNSLAPATITLGANVTDFLSSSYSVSFFSGAALLGTVSNSPYQITVNNVLPGTYSLQARVNDSTGASAFSSIVPLTVLLPANATLVNFDSLNATRAAVSGAALKTYLAGFGVAVSNLTAGTQLSVEDDRLIAGGKAALAASPHNLLTQTGSSGPVQFTLNFSSQLSQFGFTRPELLANPFVSHPAWQVTAFDGAGAVVAAVAEGEIQSSTHVAAREFSLNGQGGPGIASVEFASEGTGLTTFNAMLADNLVLTTNSLPFPPAVAITQPASGVVLASPPSLTITAAVANLGKGSVSFFANGVLIGAATNGQSAIEWLSPPVGNYELTAVAATLTGRATTSAVVNVTIQPPASQFQITSQPASQTVALGGSATFSVAVTGTNTVSYQWYFDAQQIPGATSSAYVVNPPIQDSNAGRYFVKVTSDGVTVNSARAILTVVDPPVITTQPAGQTLAAGSTVILDVGVSGDGPFSFQWLLNANAIPGATNSLYIIHSAQPRQSGNYQVVVANQAASTLSVIAPVIVETAATIPETNDTFATRATINPLLGPISDSNRMATVQNGAPLPDGLPGGNSIWFTWRPEFTGTASLTTQGSDFEAVMAVYTGTALNNLKVVAADDGSGGYLTSFVTFNVTSNTAYQIAVDGFQGASGRVVLGLPAGTGYEILNPSSANAAPVIVRGPANQTVASNAPATLSVVATSKTKMTFQWYFQGEPIPGAISSSLSIKHVLANTVGEYFVLVANPAGAVQSEPAILQVSANLGPKATSTGSKFFDTTNVSPSILATVMHPEALGGDSAGFSASQIFSTVGATSEPGQPEPCGQLGGGSEWFVYTAPASGMVLIDTAGSSFNTLLGVYTGSGASFADLVEAGCGYTTNYLTESQPRVVLPEVAKGTTFYMLVEGFEGASGTAKLQIGLGQPLVFSATPASQFVTAGNNVTFHATAIGSTPISYQWQLNGANIAGATKSALTVSAPQAPAEGNYTVMASNVLGAVTSSPPAALTLQFSPDIVLGPTNETVTEGKTAKFSVEVIGVNVKTNPLVSQWYFDGEPVPKAKALTLTIPNVNVTNAGSYYIIITNNYGEATSIPATLTVVAKTSVTAVKDVSAAPGDISGTYSGLFHPANGATLASAGYFTATVAGGNRPAYSASILLDGKSYSFSGEFDSTGNAQSTVQRFGQSPVTASLRLDLNATDGQLTGVISAADWRSVLQAVRAIPNPAPNCASRFTLAASSTNALGYLTLTNTANGPALVSGALADGATLLRVVPVDQGPTIPLYVPLYSGRGLFLGWITITNSAGTNCGEAYWIRPGATNSTVVSIVK